ncbi:MAG: peptide chain release factor 1 [Candidatus Omnitrophica bacterium]|nr:peptide chain release factor 1 [Candidatus Omnitrophota bacterium]
MVNYDKIKEEYFSISQQLSSQEVFKDKERYQSLTKRFAFISKIMDIISERDRYLKEKEHLKEIIKNKEEEKELIELAKEEIIKIDSKIKALEERIEDIFFEDDEESDRDIIVEIRAAAGGEESALFAADLFKMYSRYIENKKWHMEVLSSHPTEIGGFKEIIFSVKGKGCYSHLRFESGVHRVQRVPVTEAGGRIHTSTVTVAVLVEPKNIELKIDPNELRIDTYRAGGHGGQYVNRTDSAVRITHIPTGIVVACQDERSQIKNREKAMRVLKARLLDKMKQEESSKITRERRLQIGTGERSEKIRTYNFPERRVTDHRINLTVYRLEEILEGDLDEIIKSLIKESRAKVLQLR